jgi:hypothetical protein
MGRTPVNYFIYLHREEFTLTYGDEDMRRVVSCQENSTAIIIPAGKKLKNIRLPAQFVVCSPQLMHMKNTAGCI